jgi:hypothetical protein
MGTETRVKSATTPTWKRTTAVTRIVRVNQVREPAATANAIPASSATTGTFGAETDATTSAGPSVAATVGSIRERNVIRPRRGNAPRTARS